MTRFIKNWWPFFVMLVWFNIVDATFGRAAANLAAVTGLAVALIALWEAGSKKSASGDDRADTISQHHHLRHQIERGANEER